PMTPFPQPVGAEADDLLHHAENRIADALGLLLEARELDVLDPALSLDLPRRLRRDDAETGLCARKRGLGLEVIAGARLIGKNLPHLRRAEDVAEDRGIERRGGHYVSPDAGLRIARANSE